MYLLTLAIRRYNWLVLAFLLTALPHHHHCTTPETILSTYGTFIAERSTSFDDVTLQNATSHRSTAGYLECARECLQDGQCDAFYHDATGNACYLTSGEAMASVQIHQVANGNGGVTLTKYRRTSKIVTVTRPCPTSDGFKEMTINGQTYCFLFVTFRERYQTSRDNCLAMGAELFHFDDDPDKFSALPAIVDLFTLYNYKDTWVGLHSLESSSAAWYWHHDNHNLTEDELVSIPWLDTCYQTTGSKCALVKFTEMKVHATDCEESEEYMCEYALTYTTRV